jgi:hypothetical protein
VPDVLAVPGPRRVSITMLREVSSDDFGKAFMDGLNANTEKSERTKILPQTMKFGEVFRADSDAEKRRPDAAGLDTGRGHAVLSEREENRGIDAGPGVLQRCIAQ